MPRCLWAGRALGTTQHPPLPTLQNAAAAAGAGHVALLCDSAVRGLSGQGECPVAVCVCAIPGPVSQLSVSVARGETVQAQAWSADGGILALALERELRVFDVAAQAPGGSHAPAKQEPGTLVATPV